MSNSERPNKMFGLRIPPKLREELEIYAKHYEITLTQAILDAIKESLKK